MRARQPPGFPTSPRSACYPSSSRCSTSRRDRFERTRAGAPSPRGQGLTRSESSSPSSSWPPEAAMLSSISSFDLRPPAKTLATAAGVILLAWLILPARLPFDEESILSVQTHNEFVLERYSY